MSVNLSLWSHDTGQRAPNLSMAATSNTASHDNHDKTKHGFPLISYNYMHGCCAWPPLPELRNEKD